MRRNLRRFFSFAAVLVVGLTAAGRATAADEGRLLATSRSGELRVEQRGEEYWVVSSKDPAQQRLVGSGDDLGKLLGLDKDWSYRAIKAVGNYGEMFERNVGPKSVLKLPRGSNNLWNKGGLMYGLPVR